MDPAVLFAVAWAVFIIAWLIAASWSARTEKQAAGREVWIYRTLIVVGAVLFYHRTAHLLHARHLWFVGFGGAYALVVLTCLGFLFAGWARIYLGPLWSGEVTRKEGHKVIDTGPYAFVRHPIYTGIICATWATGAAKANFPALVGCVLITVGFWLKARIEERFLAAELGEGEYAAYRSRVPMLVPFLRGG